MSLILEALKKSEQQRRLGEAPNFGSPVVATRRRRNLLPVIAVLIVIAAAAGWWLMRRSPPAAPPAAPIANSTDAARTATQPPPIKRDMHPPAARPAGNLALDRTKQAEATAQEKRAGAAGNPARTTPPPAPPAPAAPSKPAVTAAGQPAPTLADKSAGLRTTAPPPAEAMQKPPAQKADVIAPPAPPANAQTATTPAATAKPAAPGAALPTIWELPFSTRKDLPALDLSMHVYSADPKQRFVVMKGDRHIEGDEVGQDLILREIRQDGLVLEYKGQRFFFPRTGR